MPGTISLTNLKRIVHRAMRDLWRYDRYLLDQGGLERAAAHRLAVYLEGYLPSGQNWNVDCEYRKQGLSAKFRSGGNEIQPDIIIHLRGRLKPDENLLFVEIKTGMISSKNDRSKCVDVTRPPNRSRNFQYQFGLAIAIYPKSATLEWFKAGKQVAKSRIRVMPKI